MGGNDIWRVSEESMKVVKDKRMSKRYLMPLLEPEPEREKRKMGSSWKGTGGRWKKGLGTVMIVDNVAFGT